MGAWRLGLFDNDDALDFLDSLSDAPPGGRARRIRAALTLPDGYLEMPQARQAVAAAALIAVAGGMPAGAHQEVAELIVQGGVPARDQVREQVLAALVRVAGDNSEWRQLREDGDLLAEAAATLEQLRERL